MPCALPLAVRQQIIVLYRQHYSISGICKEVPASFTTVRRLLRQYRANPGLDLKPAYRHCGPQKPRSDERLLRAARWLKRLHPKWGAPLIHLHLKERYPTAGVPAIRTLQSWFRKKGLNAPREHRPATATGGARAPHHIWQVDAKERLWLCGGQPACYLTIGDEHSGACLEALAFPPQPDQSGTPGGGAAAPLPGF